MTTTSTQLTLSNEAYVSEAFFRHECEKVFRCSWMLVGLVKEFAQPGHVHPLTVGGVPVLLVTGTDGVIRGFQNVCRHRGALLAFEPADGCRALACPYHHWSYDLTGGLLTRPHYFGSDHHDTTPGPDAPGLIPVAVDSWHHWVFVNVDASAGPLSAHVRVAERLLEGYRVDELCLLDTLEFDVPANWKLALENFWEPNHSFSLHPQLMQAGTSANRSAVEYEENVIHGAIDYETDVDPDQLPGGDTPAQQGDPQKVNRSAWTMLFPNVCLTFFPGNLGVIEVQPLSVDRTFERLHVYATEDVANEPELTQARQQIIDLWALTNQQDMDALRWTQMGRCCPGFDGGALSPYWDGAVSAFAELLTTRLNTND